MIIIKLWGGLCNQMFQYAFGYALSQTYKDEICFEANYYKNQRKGVGQRKVVIASYFPLSKYKLIERPREYNFVENRYANRIIRSIASGRQLHCGNNLLFYKEPYRKYQANIPYAKGQVNYYDGYWLTSKYFADYRDSILNEFKLNNELTQYIEEKVGGKKHEQSVAIHIRRGDYLNRKKANAPGGYTEKSLTEYYYRAIEYMTKTIDNPVFYVVSDDITWCRENFSLPDCHVEFVQNYRDKGDLLDLFCISKCKHGIMSPSTFSWWGNWLRDNIKESVVIVPKGNYANDYFFETNWISM